MSRWVPIDVEALEDAKVAALVDALRTAALGDGQTDPSTAVIASIVAEVRRKVASNRANSVDDDESTIPASLVPLVSDLVIFRLKNRLEIPLTQDERDARDRHQRTLDRIADGTDVIEQPDTATPAEVQATGGTPSISTTRAEARRSRREGL